MLLPSPDLPIADFDSASAMLRALTRHLHGADFPALGLGDGLRGPALRLLGTAVNALPDRTRKQFYLWGGWSEALPPEQLGSVHFEQVCEWVVDSYPARRYPAALVGSSNGALTHLAAALGIPWLPQTFLIPVRHGGLPHDEPERDLEFGRRVAGPLLEANPDLALHQMHDDNQDHLMIQRMSYFRVKRRRLGPAYERFLDKTLEPGGTLFLVECGLSWPTVRVGDRHVFQNGALGGLDPMEYYEGSPRVAEYLARLGSPRRSWGDLRPDGESPEAEWGFDPALRDDVARFARSRGYLVRRIVFDQPEDVSPLVADLHRAWYVRRRMPACRLLAESFINIEPHWALRTGSVPFWLAFDVKPSADALGRYLDNSGPFDEIYLTLFPHGADSIGLAPIERWRALLSRARKRGEFLGVEEDLYPRDFATMPRYHRALRRSISARYPISERLTLGTLKTFLDAQAHRYPVRWTEEEPMPEQTSN